MARVISNCALCLESYDDQEHRPLILRCGHTFCCTCLSKFEGDRRKCPNCRQEWSCPVDELTVCYQLIPDNDEAEETKLTNEVENSDKEVSKNRTCLEHELTFMLWCKDCLCEMCSDCHIHNHKECKYSPLKFDATNPFPSPVQFRTELDGRVTTILKDLDDDLAVIEEDKQRLDKLQVYVTKILSLLEEKTGFITRARTGILHSKNIITSTPMPAVNAKSMSVEAIRMSTNIHIVNAEREEYENSILGTTRIFKLADAVLVSSLSDM